MGARLNVRCCCEPERILGTLPVPMEAARRGFFQVARRASPVFTMRVGKRPGPGSVTTLRGAETILIKPFAAGPRAPTELAVYSDELPIEFWREIPGFVEGDRVEVAA